MGFSFHFNKPAPKRRTVLMYDSSQPVKLQPPEEVNVKIEEEELAISWTRVPGARYNVYAKHSSQQSWTKLNKTELYNNKMNFKKPIILGQYVFKITSVYQGKESTFSKEAKIDIK
jgi:hypothetical protein